MARILAVGNATLDIVNRVERYPREDDEVRALAQFRVRGGNAANTLVVLSQLGHDCRFAGTLADEPDGAAIMEDLARHAIDLGAVRLHPGKAPTSYVTLSAESGSRTIVHYRDLPEYRCGDLRAVPLDGLDWIHFEGRNVAELRCMMEWVRGCRPELPLSLEAEKPRDGIEALFPYASVIIFSRHFARQKGFTEAEPFLRRQREGLPAADLFCGWGDGGAYALDRTGDLLFTPPFPPPKVIDTLGAGDVFNAGIIDGMTRGLSIEETLRAAARLAGRKCGRQGLEGLGGSEAGSGGD